MLLTHIGYESGLNLAGMVKSEWGVDMILGGHPHSVLDMSIEVNGILEYNWRLVPINEQAAESDLGLHQ